MNHNREEIGKTFAGFSPTPWEILSRGWDYISRKEWKKMELLREAKIQKRQKYPTQCKLCRVKIGGDIMPIGGIKRYCDDCVIILDNVRFKEKLSRCEGVTKGGNRCKNPTNKNKFCAKHLQKIKKKLPRCEGTTRSGYRCSNPVNENSRFCGMHQYQKAPATAPKR